MLGVVCAGAGGALWATSRSALPALAFVAFGSLLIGLGIYLHFLVKRDAELAPEEAHVWNEGIEILLRNGEIRAASWTDPHLALAILVRYRRGSTEPERLFYWRTDPRVPPTDLSGDGLDRLLRAAATHDVVLSQERKGRSPRAPRFYAIEGRPTIIAQGPPKGKSTQSPPVNA